VEPVAEPDPARRYLWALAASDGSGDPLGPAAEALVAIGALAGDDPVIELVTAALEEDINDDLPAEWRSALGADPRTDGPTGLILVGAITPRFDGRTAAVLALESEPSGFIVAAEVTPGVWDLEVAEPPLAWWARDDRGQYYRSWTESWGADSARGSGRLEFRPALDPQARTLDIMPTAASERAVIRIPLDWAP
jgi:hypothetical protein